MRRTALAVGLIALVAGCGGSGDQDPITHAVRTMGSKGSVRAMLVSTSGRRESRIHLAFDFDHDRGRETFKASKPGVPTEVRYIGDAVYFRFPGSPQWAKAAEPKSAFSQIDPRTLLMNALAAAHGVGKKSADVLHGVPMTRYHLVVGPSSSKFVVGLPGLTVPIDVWVDGSGLVRRLREAAAGGEVDYRFFDYGAPLDIEQPPPALVTTGSIGIQASP